MAQKNCSTSLRLYHESDSHKRHQELLWGLKFTVEGLLAAHTTNVWSTYGGLTRLCGHIDQIMRHRLKHPMTNDDYWEFVMGLRRLQPVLAPSIDRIHRQSLEQGVDGGGLWLHTSLESHTLASQLRTLVDDGEHLAKFYHGDAFLRSPAQFKALYVCLQSVEQNNASLLADLDPMLLQNAPLSSRSRTQLEKGDPAAPQKLTESALEVQPPSFSSSKSDSILTTSDEHARPKLARKYQTESARDVLQSLLGSSCAAVSLSNQPTKEECAPTTNDPLMNKEISTMETVTASPPRRKELRRSRTAGDIPTHGVFPPPAKEPKLLFEYSSSPPQGENSPPSLGTSPLGSLYEEETSDGLCQCSTKTAPDLPAPKRRTSESSVEVTCRVCGKKRRNSIQPSGNAVLTSKILSSASPPQAKSSTYAKAYRPSRHSQSSMNPVAKSEASKKIQTHTRSKSDQLNKSSLGNVLGVSEGARSTTTAPEKTSTSLPIDSNVVPRKNSLLEEGTVSPATEFYFPQPLQGQSLLSFLTSRDFDRIPELDRENAHFSISEAIIAAIEQIRSKQQHVVVSDHESDGSDEEIQHLKQRIRLRRFEKRQSKMRGGRGVGHSRTRVLEDSEGGGGGRGDSAGGDSGVNTLTSSVSTLPISSTDNSPHDSATETDDDSLSGSSDSVADIDMLDPQESNLKSLQGVGLSTSLASLYSVADLGKAAPQHSAASPPSPPAALPPTIDPPPPRSNVPIVNSNVLSAESVALCLLRKFSAKQLPPASALQWLVSEQDAPQSLLPMPKSLPISPDDGENADIYTKKNTRLRGNADWAPPRSQIIFIIHPQPKRKVLVAKQNYRCAGCGMRIERGFVKRLRYCEYLGKYFCHCCHSNSTAVIPGRILWKWDFQKVPVSNFSRELLDKMYEDPLFNVLDVNPVLYRKSKQLNNCKELRKQLFFLKDFLKTCRLSQSLQATYESRPTHLLREPHVYSLSDLHRARSGEMESELRQLTEDAVTHVRQCQLCQAKGFICEVCNNDHDIIFPFQLEKTYQCQDCWACYHRSCFQVGCSCPKCLRKTARKISQSKLKTSNLFSDDKHEAETKR